MKKITTVFWKFKSLYASYKHKRFLDKTDFLFPKKLKLIKFTKKRFKNVKLYTK